MQVQTYQGRHYIISNGRIIGDFTHQREAEHLVDANNRENPPHKQLLSSLDEWRSHFAKKSHPVSLTLARAATTIRDHLA